MQEFQSLINSTQRLSFQGQESITRLVCLNRLAHLAVLEAISNINDPQDIPFAEEQARHLDRFTRNRQCLNCLEMLTGEAVRDAFEKIKQRLVADIRFFLEREKVSPIRQKMEEEKGPPVWKAGTHFISFHRS